MIIKRIEAVPISLPFVRRTALSTGTRASSEHLLVVVESEDGVRGYAECTPRPTLYGESISGARVIIEQLLAPRVRGLRLDSQATIRTRLAEIAGNPSARAAVEIAAFDAFARSCKLSAVTLLGGHATAVPLCAMLGYARPDGALEEAQSVQERWGITAFKFKVGRDARNDIAVARALREGLGDSAILYADANQQYSFEDAVRFLRATQELDLPFVEEPTGEPSHLALGRMVSYPLLADESAADVAAAYRSVTAGYCRGVSIKPARSGLSDSALIRDVAVMAGVAPVIGSQGDAAIGALVAAAFAAAHPETSRRPAELAFFTTMAAHLVQVAPTIRDGELLVPDGPGFGFEIDPPALDLYRSDR
jgi:L-alanine-DL-glutamate epimerase-like enolase superfamily enzyme